MPILYVHLIRPAGLTWTDAVWDLPLLFTSAASTFDDELLSSRYTVDYLLWYHADSPKVILHENTLEDACIHAQPIHRSAELRLPNGQQPKHRRVLCVLSRMHCGDKAADVRCARIETQSGTKGAQRSCCSLGRNEIRRWNQ